MKKKLAILLASIMTVTAFAACDNEKDEEETKATTAGSSETVESTEGSQENTDLEPVAQPSADSISGDLTVWGITDESRTVCAAFKAAYPNVNVEVQVIPMNDGSYETKLQSAISSGDVPDVIALEAQYIKAYVEQEDILEDLSYLKGNVADMQVYPFITQVGTTPSGKLEALSYQAAVGTYYYRRSLAKKYLGTDDPTEVQKMLGSLDKFKEAAEKIKTASNGKCFIIADIGELTQPFLNNRENGWVVDGKLNIDPKVNELLDYAKTFRENGYDAQTPQWAPNWFAGFNGDIANEAGETQEIFGYFLPSWGLPFCIMPNAKDTAGDWAVIEGPIPYNWGGTWYAVMAGAKHKDAAKAFVQYVTLNSEFLANWSTGVYTNEYCKSIVPDFPDGLAQGAGDFICSEKTYADIVDAAYEQTKDFMGGQNAFEVFKAGAANINTSIFQGTDNVINMALGGPLGDYATGAIDMDTAINNFKSAVATALPNSVTVE